MYSAELHISANNPVAEMEAIGADYCIVLAQPRDDDYYIVEVWTYELNTMRAVIEEYYEDEPEEVDFFMENSIFEGELNVTEFDR